MISYRVGKKYNPLKQRIDNCDYDIDQLLLGTLLFTLFFFLLPTTMIYYLFFALVRFAINLIYATAFLILDSINHFPAYALFKYLTDIKFLPG